MEVVKDVGLLTCGKSEFCQRARLLSWRTLSTWKKRFRSEYRSKWEEKSKVKERHNERNKARNREGTRNNQPLIVDGMRMI